MSDARTRARLAWLPALPLVLGLTGCSDDEPDDAAAEPTETEVLCADWAELRTAVTALAEIDVVADGTEALQTAALAVGDALRQLRGSAQDSLDAEVDELGQAVDDLGTALAGLPDRPDDETPGSGLVAVGEAVGTVSTTADAVGDELQPACAT